MDLLTYIIICPLVFLAGFVDAVAGGGGLISLPAYIIAGIPVHNSIATNKLSSCMGTLLTTGKFAKDGLIPWKPALAGVIFAFAGSSLGAHIALILDARIFMTAMLFILPVTAFYVTRKKSMAEKEPFPFQKQCFSAAPWRLSLAFMTVLRPGHGNIPHPSPYGCRPCPPERGERHHESYQQHDKPYRAVRLSRK